MRRRGRIAAGVIAVAVVGGAAVQTGVTGAAAKVVKPPPPVARTVTINGFLPPPFKFSKRIFVKGKTYAFTVKNVDFQTHDWRVFKGKLNKPPKIGNGLFGTKDLAPGKKQIVRFKFLTKGTYSYFCTISGHESFMKGTFVVG